MRPFFTIVTPTIQRESLLKCCSSVDFQSFNEWQHIIYLDRKPTNWNLMEKIEHPNRLIVECETEYKDYGNTPRHLAWECASGKWIWHLDCDNRVADEHILRDMAEVLYDVEEPITFFPILRHGRVFLTDPPSTCHVDTMNMVLRHNVAQWPYGPQYTMDGIHCDNLVAKYPRRVFDKFRPIGIMEYSSEGK